MAWTTPSTRAVGDMITAAIYNDEIVNNLKMLHEPRTMVIPLVAPGTTGGITIATTGYTPLWFTQHTLSASRFPSTGTVKLHVTGSSSPLAGPFNVELYDVSASAAVASSPTTNTAAWETISADFRGSLTTGARPYQLAARCVSGNGALYGAWLQVEW